MPQFNLSQKIIIALVLGIVVGLIFKPLNTVLPSIGGFWIGELFSTLGQIFIALLKMLVIPLVFFGLVSAVSSMNTINLGKTSALSIVFYLCSTAIAISIALFIASVFHIGLGMQMNTHGQGYPSVQITPLKTVVLNLFPANPIQAMSEGKIFPLIIFAFFIGLALLITANDHGQRIKRFFVDTNEVMLNLVMLVIRLSPIGVFCLIVPLFFHISPGKIMSLAGYFFTVILVLIIQMIIVYGGLLYAIAKQNPWTFIKRFYPAMIFAFSTSSSYATLPVTLRTCREKLKIPQAITAFTLPIGATINMDGTAIMQGCATVFIANAYGIHLNLLGYLMVILTATLSSIGTAGVPGVGLVTLVIVLEQVGIPIDGIAMIIGIDRILDMLRTAVNVTGDATVARLIQHFTRMR